MRRITYRVANMDLRKLMKQKDVCQWEVAKKMGETESGLSRRMREELSEGEKQIFRKVVEMIVKEHREVIT